MGLYDRDYTREGFESQYRYTPRMRIGMPQLTPVVKWLLIVNVAIFFISFPIAAARAFFFSWFSVFPVTVGMALQLWRPVTYQFLHAGPFHIFWNMLVLYFFGPMLERFWGSRKFLLFYLLCGAAGGIFYPLLALSGWLDIGPLVGASGAILGTLAAGAILFPNIIVYVWGIFPLRLIVLALILAAMSILTLLAPDQFANSGGEAAHLAGMATGAAYVLTERWRSTLKFKLRNGLWKKKLTTQRQLQLELDRILDKVHKSGIHSLTYREKRILRRATKIEQMRNKT